MAPPWTQYLHDDDDPDDDWFDDHDHDDHDHDDHDHDDDDHDDDDDRDEPGGSHRDSERRQLEWFTASVILPDGRWLNVSVGTPPVTPPWGWTFVLTFLLSAFGIGVVAILSGHRIAKPMRSLATAADRLGRGETVEELPEAGPQETRSTVRAFNLMRKRLDRFVHDRTAMLAAISHDLRTPITSLRLHAEFVEDGETKTKLIAALDEIQRMTEGHSFVHPGGRAAGRDAESRPPCAGRQHSR